MTGRVFTRLFVSYVLVLAVGLPALAFHLRDTPAHWLEGVFLAWSLSLLAAVLAATLLARRNVRQHDSIIAFAKRIVSGDLSARVEESEPAEPGGLKPALDAAAARLERDVRALEANRRELTVLLDSMQEGVIAINAHGNVSWSNAVMRRIVTTPIQAGRALVHSIRDPEVLAAAAIALNQREACCTRAIFVSPGKIFEVNAAPMPGGGAVAVLHDVSEIERAETTRRDFVANVSHELRTPLTCVTGYVETLLDEKGLSGQAREFLLIILKNATRMNRLTEDLLALASVESADYRLHLRTIAASALVEDAIASLAGLVLDSDLVLETGETTADLVMADPDALHQVFGNLVENATKYGKSGGRILLGARRNESPDAQSAVEFYVQDFGSGIAYEHLTRIFERFYRVDKARSHDSGGTGLGLAIVKHIVHAHGGEIRCESELGSGATFVFTLPCESKAVLPSASSEEAVAHQGFSPTLPEVPAEAMEQ